MRNKVKATEDNLMWESFISEASAQPQASSGELLEESADALAPTEMEGMNSNMAAYAAALSRSVSK